jgi:cytochrome d ubiquinol oxidase subunit I
MAALFGVLATAAVLTLGDALGFVGAHAQPTKLAAMEALWETERAPMPFNVVAIPSQSERRNLWQIQIPAMLSILVTHSLDGSVPGFDVLEARALYRVRNGIPAVAALQRLSAAPGDDEALTDFEQHRDYVGYGFLAQRYAPEGDLSKLTEEDLRKAALDTIPEVWIVFWSFRIMIGLGLLMLAYFVLATMLTLRNRVERERWFLWVALWMIPVPFLACEVGWLVAEIGRQPWSVYEVLPTWLSASTHSVGYMVFSLCGFLVLYSIFIVIEMYLMVRFVRQGPDNDEREAGGGVAMAATN